MEKEGLRNSQRNFAVLLRFALPEPELENDDCDSCLSLVKDIKEELKIWNKEETVQLVTIIPDDWPIEKTAKFLMLLNTWLKRHKYLKRNRVFERSRGRYKAESEIMF